MYSRTMTATKKYKLSVRAKDGSIRSTTQYGDIIGAMAGKAMWEARGFTCNIEEIIRREISK